MNQNAKHRIPSESEEAVENSLLSCNPAWLQTWPTTTSFQVLYLEFFVLGEETNLANVSTFWKANRSSINA